MKRICTLVGSIVAFVIDSLYSIYMIIGISTIFDALTGDNGTAHLAVIGLFEIIIGILASTFNGLTIPLFSCSHEKYTSKKGVIIASIVFNYALALLCIFAISYKVSLVAVMLLLTSIAAVVLDAVDMSLEKMHYDKAINDDEEDQD